LAVENRFGGGAAAYDNAGRFHCRRFSNHHAGGIVKRGKNEQIRAFVKAVKVRFVRDVAGVARAIGKVQFVRLLADGFRVRPLTCKTRAKTIRLSV
jgi:hypothetical protein